MSEQPPADAPPAYADGPPDAPPAFSSAAGATEVILDSGAPATGDKKTLTSSTLYLTKLATSPFAHSTLIAADASTPAYTVRHHGHRGGGLRFSSNPKAPDLTMYRGGSGGGSASEASLATGRSSNSIFSPGVAAEVNLSFRGPAEAEAGSSGAASSKDYKYSPQTGLTTVLVQGSSSAAAKSAVSFRAHPGHPPLTWKFKVVETLPKGETDANSPLHGKGKLKAVMDSKPQRRFNCLHGELADAAGRTVLEYRDFAPANPEGTRDMIYEKDRVGEFEFHVAGSDREELEVLAVMVLLVERERWRRDGGGSKNRFDFVPLIGAGGGGCGGGA